MAAAFTKLELAALRSIFSETPEISGNLERQLVSASVSDRENTGHGFFTMIEVPENAPEVISDRVLGYETNARVTGLEHGFSFVLFMGNGKLHQLEGYAFGPEDTCTLDLENLAFEIFKVPMQRFSERQ